MPQRLWCDFEIVLARTIRKPIFMWPHASWKGKLGKLQGKIAKLDVSQSRASDTDNERKLRGFIGSTGGGFATVSSFIQSILSDRIKFFARACQRALLESDNASTQALASGLIVTSRVRQLLARFEAEDVRQFTLQDLLHSDYEFADIAGPFFPSSDVVEPVFDSTLGAGCLVSRVRGSNGLNRLKCTGKLELGFGTWRVGFVMRRVLPAPGCALRKEYFFHEEVALSLNGTIEKCTTLSKELGTEWQLLEVGEVTVPGSGLGLITQEVYTGTLSHRSIQKGASLPSLKVPAQLSASYQAKPKCMSKTCECKTRPSSDYGLFIDRCYAFRQSPWVPSFQQGLPQRLIRAEPSFRVL